MDNGKMVLVRAFLAVLLFTGACWASDEALVAELPNPFAPVPIHTESKGAKWRHGLHDVRTTWDKYFEVVPKELDGFSPVTLDKVRAEPSFYLDRKIRFDIYMGKSGAFFKPLIAPFHLDHHVNFSAWGYGTELWTKEGRGSVLPLFYVDRRRKELIEKLEHLPMYTPVHVWAEVRSKSESLPWIEIHGAEVIPEATVNDAILRHLELGTSQLAKKRFDLAAQAFEVAVRMELPVQIEAKVFSMLGRAYYELRQFCAAREALVSAVMRDDRNVPALIYLARTDSRIERFAEGRQAAERALTLEPANPEARAELGLALALTGDIQNGYKELDHALKLAPRNQLAEAFRNRAVLALIENKSETAESELSKALLLKPTDFGLHMELGDVYLTRAKLDKAQLEYVQSRDLAPLRPEPFYKTALVIKMQADQLVKDNKLEEAKTLYTDALKNAQDAIAKDPQFTPAYSLEAELLRALNRQDDARKALEKGAQANPRNAELNRLAQEAKQPEPEKTEGAEAAPKLPPVIEEPNEVAPIPAQVPGPR